MNRILIILVYLYISSNLLGQQWNNDTICSNDTLIIKPRYRTKFSANPSDSELIPYKIIRCITRSNIGYRFELGYSNYYYGSQMTNWIGQHGGPNFNFIVTIDKLNFGFRFKPWTVNPKKEMEFGGKIVPTTADLNIIKLDYYLGYSFDFSRLFSLEPYVGYNRSLFIVIN